MKRPQANIWMSKQDITVNVEIVQAVIIHISFRSVNLHTFLYYHFLLIHLAYHFFKVFIYRNLISMMPKLMTLKNLFSVAIIKFITSFPHIDCANNHVLISQFSRPIDIEDVR